MDSQKSNESIRLPQRRRGHERVASLLEAAANCFVERGYDAATMTAIAVRAGASIGSLYQFFPTKELLAQALMTNYTKALHGRLARLAARSDGWDTDQLAAQLIRLLPAFRRGHPAFAVLAESAASLPALRGMAVRRSLREALQSLLRERFPALDAAARQAAAVVVLQLMKAAVTLNAEAGLRGRKAVRAQLQLTLRLYLHALAKQR